MRWRLLGIVLGLVGLLCFAFAYQYLILHFRKAHYYCAVAPYNFNGGTSLNQTEFQQHLNIVKDLGFEGIVVHTFENFYLEGLTDWLFEAAENRSLNVMLAVYYVNLTNAVFPLSPSAYNRTGFMTNDAELYLFIDYLKNVSQIAIAHPNFKGYILFYVFRHEERDFWLEQIKTAEYARRMQVLISALNDSKPLYLTAEPWGAENSTRDVYEYLPKNFTGVDGFALQGYNFVIDDIQFEEVVTNQSNYWRQYFGEIHIAEFGYRTIKIETYHGLASSEQSKANMIREFIKKTWLWNSFVTYFCLTDFWQEGKKVDWGLIFDNQTYRPAAYVFKEMLKN
jgi:hypothetical protein